jgi:hypothetical protein
MGNSTDDDKIPDFGDVMNAARRWYYGEIRSLADEAIKECLEDAEDDDTDARREWLTTWIDETTDGHEYVIYTAKAGMVCVASDNDDAYESESGEKPPSVEAQACLAMRADVWQLLDARSDEWEATPPDDDDDGAVSP